MTDQYGSPSAAGRIVSDEDMSLASPPAWSLAKNKDRLLQHFTSIQVAAMTKLSLSDDTVQEEPKAPTDYGFEWETPSMLDKWVATGASQGDGKVGRSLIDHGDEGSYMDEMGLFDNEPERPVMRPARDVETPSPVTAGPFDDDADHDQPLHRKDWLVYGDSSSQELQEKPSIKGLRKKRRTREATEEGMPKSARKAAKMPDRVVQQIDPETGDVINVFT
jgi:hypothetical protein